MNDVFDPNFCVYRVPLYFQNKIDIEKSLNSVRISQAQITNEDAEIILIGHRPRFCIYRPAMEARPPGIPVREFPGIADPQNSWREFPGISEILAGITVNFASFVFFPIFIVDYDILVFNLIAPFKQNLE